MKLHGNLHILYIDMYSIICIVVIREDFSKLTYTTMCIKETLRIYTLAPIIYKVTPEDMVAGGYKVPKGMSNTYS